MNLHADEILSILSALSSDGLILVDIDRTITHLNETAETILEISRKDLVGQPVATLESLCVSAEDERTEHAGSGSDGLSVFVKGEGCALVRVGRSVGVSRWVEVSSSKLPPTHDTSLPVYMLKLKDMTASRLFEQTMLFISRERRGGQDGLLFHELVKFLAQKLNVAYAFVGQIAPPFDRARTLALYADGRLIDNMDYELQHTPCEGVANRSACVFPKKVQELFPLDQHLADMQAEGYADIPLRNSAGEVIGLIGVIDRKPLVDHEVILRVLRLVSERAAAQLERQEVLQVLKESEQKFRNLSVELRALLDSIPDPILLLNPERKVVWANSMAVRSLQAKYGVEGLPCFELEPCREAFCTDCVVKSVLASGHHAEKTMRTQDGRLWEVRGFPVFDAEGAVRNVLEMRIDISEKERLRNEAARAHQLALLGEVAAGIAHEINNPIGLVAWQLPLINDFAKQTFQLVDNQVESPDSMKVGGLSYSLVRDELPGMLEDMSNAIERVRGILNELKCFAQPPSYELSELIDLNEVVRRSAILIGRSFSAGGHQLDVRYAQQPLWVEGHLQRLEQVVLNLLLNAAQAVPSNAGKVTVVLLTEDNARHGFRITDNGCGIEETILNHLTAPFFTTRRDQGGTGLGLSISQSIVQNYHGEMEFSSRSGTGTEVTVWFPAASDHETLGTFENETPSSPEGTTRRK